MMAHIKAALAALCLAVGMSGGLALAAERTVTLGVDGMSCESCPYIVKQSLARVDGVKTVAVSFEKKIAVVTFDDARTDVSKLTRATADAGFPSRVLDR
jgi:mercuric ion binding protein